MSPALNLTNGIVHAHAHATDGLKKHIDGFGTRAVHVGSDANEETGAVIPPISLSTTYKQSSIGVHKVN
jgi:cystathionine gamma-lyase